MKEVVFTKEMKQTHKILIPMMAPIHFQMISHVFRNNGYDVEVLTNESSAVVDEGLKHVHNDTCYPALLVIGQMIDALKSGKYDLEHVALLITQTGGGCRASNYYHLLKKALAKDGMDYIPVISLNVSGLEKNPGFKVTAKMWENLAAVVLYGDMLMALRNQCRVYEVHKGETDALVDSWISKLNEQFKDGKGYGIRSVKKNMCQIAHDFAMIERDGKKCVKVGVVGEIYVKFSPLGNNHLEDFLYEQDAEVNLPGLLGFAFYCIYNSVLDYELYGGNKMRYKGAKALMDMALHFEDIMIDAIKKEPSLHAPNSFRHTIKLNEDEQGISFGVKMGEGWLLTAEMLELIDEGYDNIICTQPFGCLPNHIVGKGMVRKIKQIHEDANIVPIDYDPSATKVNQENRIKLMLSVAREKLNEPVKA